MSNTNRAAVAGDRAIIGPHRLIDQLTDAEASELADYAFSEGRKWRNKLSLEWSNGSDKLRGVRNKLGPGNLYKLSLWSRD